MGELAYMRDVHQSEGRCVRELRVIDSYHLVQCLEADLDISLPLPVRQGEVLKAIRQDSRSRSHRDHGSRKRGDFGSPFRANTSGYGACQSAGCAGC